MTPSFKHQYKSETKIIHAYVGCQYTYAVSFPGNIEFLSILHQQKCNLVLNDKL
jgi:hypothetical protein